MQFSTPHTHSLINQLGIIINKINKPKNPRSLSNQIKKILSFSGKKLFKIFKKIGGLESCGLEMDRGQILPSSASYFCVGLHHN